MKTKDIIANISRMKWELEVALEENGGELTEELMEKYTALEDMKALLAGEGIDDLGRWLKSIQDEKATAKAEADAAARKVKNLGSYEDYVKGLIGQAMDLLELPTNDKGEKVAKGEYYGFKRTTSVKSSVDGECLEDVFLPQIMEVVGCGFLPSWVHVKLTSTTNELRNAGGDALAFLLEDTAPAVTFTKPRANSKKNVEE